jgi:Flp pilus assembly protein TadD/transglutaminase-like putative cysteine protease
MKSFCIAALCALAFSSSIAAQQKDAATAAPQSVAKTAEKKSPPADFSQEPFVIEKYYATARFESDGTGEHDLTARIRVQSDAGVQQLGELVFGYNSANEQMDVRIMRVGKSDGSVVNAASDTIKEMTASVARDAPEYTDYKEKHITVPSLHTGDTIEYEIVTRIVKPLAPNQFWYEQNFVTDAIVLDERLEVNVAQGRALIIDSQDFSNVTGQEVRKVRLTSNGDGIDDDNSPFSKHDANGRTLYRWKHANLTHPADDDDSGKKTASPRTKPPDVQLTTFKNWNEVAAWYADLEKGRTDPTPEIRAKAQQLIQGRATELEKIQALYAYVAQNIRYVSLSFGLGRYQPHSAGDVFKNQYGDCKDKHILLATMLAAADIPSDAALIPFARPLDTSVPSPSQFDHIITAVPSGSDLIWMDSTAEVAPFRMLSAPLRNKSALLVQADGAGKIVETPIDPPFLSTQRVEIDAQVSDLGKLSAKLRYFLRGDNEYALRVAFRRTPQTQWKELGQTIAALDGIKGDVTHVKPSDPTDTAKPFELELEFSQAGYLDWSSKKSKVGVPLLAIGMPDASQDSIGPIHLGSPLDVTMNLKMTLPSNFVARAPVAVSVDRDYAQFKSSYHYEDHVLTAERTLNFKMRDLPAARLSDYLAFTRAVESDETQILVVENSITGAPAIPATASAAELLEAGIASLNSGNSREAIPLLERANQLDPKSKQGWNDLGLAYLRLGEFSDAATAFRKQVEVNPYDEHVYNYLGLTLQQQRKYDEAATAFRKQLEINPLDPIAHAALGALFLEQHKYAEAVPELDKATVLAPENAELEVSLGQAFLNTGEKDKALEAFEKGIELKQTPVVWNNVAYNLAQHGIELDRAAQYAESAVSATAASLRNIELSRLSLDDLNQVSSIGVYWDTLGWIYFQKGDLDKAQRYVRASWLLDQHGEVGDHLAQIYEKRGEKEQAERTYAQAIAAAHSVPETRTRLVSLVGDDAKIDGLADHAKLSLAKLRTFSMGKLLTENAQADFFVLLSPGVKNPKVDSVKFISGSQDLRPFAEQIRAIEFGAMFPDASPAKLVRRGTLACSATTGNCSFTMILPEDVRTLN